MKSPTNPTPASSRDASQSGNATVRTSIEVRGVTKSFGGRGKEEVRALDGIDLDVGEGEFVTLIGPSGCGKTTLLRLIAGLTKWDEGHVMVDGEPVTGPAPDRAMVFQSFALMPWATVMRNVAFGLELRRVPKRQREATAQHLIDLVGLSGFERRLPGELSGGMQQRVGLARALAIEPKTLLMDEPFGALDEQTKRLMQEELLRIWEADRKTVVFVTHSLDEAVLLADRAVIMSPRPGRIAEIVDIPLERPRRREMEADPRFVETKAHLWERLRDLQVIERG